MLTRTYQDKQGVWRHPRAQLVLAALIAAAGQVEMEVRIELYMQMVSEAETVTVDDSQQRLTLHNYWHNEGSLGQLTLLDDRHRWSNRDEPEFG